MIDFAYIAPTKLTPEAIELSDVNMVLAHIAKKDDAYAAMFKNSDKFTILDNGAFENGVPMSAEEMVAIGEKVGADCLVLPDYPYEYWEKGWINIHADIDTYREAGFKCMFVPQSNKDDANGFFASIEKALEHPYINLIGLSILGCPNAGLDRGEILYRYKDWFAASNRFHILGMLDSVDEIARISLYDDMVHSWDTSAPIWYGVNCVSVVGRTKKFTKPVDFNSELEWNSIVDDNLEYMEGLK